MRRAPGTADHKQERSFFGVLSEQTWLLPVATATFVLFVGGPIVAVLLFSATAWLIVPFLLPSFIVTWLGLVVALADLLQRPAYLFPGGRTLWLIMIALFNVLAFLPYWLFVARRPRVSRQPEFSVDSIGRSACSSSRTSS
ncbi:hypothetical protein NET03_12725 [Thermomicrobium sp. CFH 73360]|uniref:hypothetical protein n=1 Tax=Thermomicrobium sp. CFH 73360 TaxID=2951987 RepID=UPI0020771251|nr:hypothetical protein [Thermomicrobium sp. CFH 73360]MCM8747386.1 hypothetical protein [Thermomicrobium sp. CFH 73360]